MISFTRKQNIKYLFSILLIIVIVFAGIKLYNNHGKKTDKSRNMFIENAPKNVFDTLRSNKGNQNIALIDFRTPGEYNEEHINGALWYNYFDENYKEKLSTLDKNKVYFVYDKAGRITSKIVKKMKDLGFKEVHRITGGLNEWKQQKLPLDFQN
jgi:rhodanese-related sulfurtransferase